MSKTSNKMNNNDNSATLLYRLTNSPVANLTNALF